MANVLEFRSDQVSDAAKQIAQVQQELANLAKQASRLQSTLGEGRNVRVGVSARLSTGSYGGGTAAQALGSLSRGIQASAAKSDRLSAAVRTTVNKFLEAESGIAGKRTMSTSQAAQMLHYPADTSQWTNSMWDKYYSLSEGSDTEKLPNGATIVRKDNNFYLYGIDGELLASFEDEKDWHSRGLTYREYYANGGFAEEKVDFDVNIGKGIELFKKKLIEPGEDKDVTYYDKDGNPLTGKKADEVKDYMTHKRVATVLEFAAEASGKAGIFSESFAYEGDNGVSASGTAEFMTFGYSASVKGGLYVEKVGPDGKTRTVLSPGLSAEIGAEATIAHVDAKVAKKLGIVEFSAESSVDVGHAAMKADAQIGIVDGKVAAKVSAKAEANLIEAKLKGGVDVGGVKGTVEGGVTVGVGAHAEIGYYDGHISCDIGASLGIGASVKFDLDVSGLANSAIGKGIEKVSEGVSDITKGVGEVVDGVRSICKGASKVISKLKFW